MVVNRDNLIDALGYYMSDNDVDYIQLRASLGFDGNMRVSISEDIELEDE